MNCPKSSEVRLGVYDMLGREVAVLVNAMLDAGVHEATFDGSASCRWRVRLPITGRGIRAIEDADDLEVT